MSDVMIGSGRDGRFECHVRYQDGEGARLPPAEAAGLCRYVEKRARAWGLQICAFVDMSPSRAVTITLKPGVFLSMTRGADIVIGVSAGTVSAALAHELVHAIVGPSASQMYAEGLAVHVDSQLRLAGGAWPFFDLAPDRWTQLFVEDDTFVPLSELMACRRILPSQEEGISAAARLYLEAASFVGFSIDLLGIDAFWPYFYSGTAPACRDIDSLQAAWLARLGGSVTADERLRREAALARVVDDGRHGVAPRTPSARSTQRRAVGSDS